MNKAKKRARQQRALERLERDIEVDGLGHARNCTFSQGMQHHALKKALGLYPNLPPAMHPRDPRALAQRSFL